MLSIVRPSLLAAALAAVAIAMPATAETGVRTAASTGSAAATGEAPAAVKEFTDQELKSFAAASLRVEEIGSKWQPKISGAEDQAAEEKLREQAMTEMVEAVQQKGLSVDRYNRIALAVQSDPDIARTVQNFRAEQP